MAWIKMVPEDEARGHVRLEYEAAQKRAGGVANIIRLMSLDGDILRASMSLYKTTMLAPGPLSRLEREAMATFVSALNQCHY